MKTKKSKVKSLRYACYKCDARFISHQARSRHEEEDHKPPTKKTISLIRTDEPHRLVDGTNLGLGDRIKLNKEGVITKITITEKSNIAEVEISVTKDEWERSVF